MEFTWSEWLKSQLFTTPLLYWRDLSGQTILITGGNSGLGLEAAKHLASMNPQRIIIACRDTKKGDAIKDSLIGTSVEIWPIDLDDFSSVTAFIRRYQKSGYDLDIFLSNAGVGHSTFNVTRDGHESTVSDSCRIQTNHLSNTLLILGLLPVLRQTAEKKGQARIAVTSSEMHLLTSFVEKKYIDEDLFAALADRDKCTTALNTERYGVSKLFQVYTVNELAPLLSKDKIAIHSFTPGLCHSDIARLQSPLMQKVDYALRTLLGRSAEVGSRTLVHVCVHESLRTDAGPNGRYFTDCRERGMPLMGIEIRTNRQGRDRQVGGKVVKQSVQLLMKYAPDIVRESVEGGQEEITMDADVTSIYIPESIFHVITAEQ
ncbi:hypothetical protein PROFUN_01013 [Planoprotostelium fungivorum]|uniref:NAD(P)-binding protein n=1 Tax=Planoprotostelium fungivorum TaxID=1890364 RepID=A0A2P6N4F0_9EUKA|nr:hypothetical protein PROFUN_01013 [Planoprotostelium fungivorum]